jgi:putative ABC transport system permease protein
MSGLLHDIRYALISLARRPAFLIAVALVLALGIGATTAMVTIVNVVALQPLPFPQSDRLQLVSHEATHPRRAMGPGLSESFFVDFKEHTTSFEQVTTYSTRLANISGIGDALRAQTATVDPDFFSVLGVGAAIGRTFSAADTATAAGAVLVLSDLTWRSHFGADPQIIGRNVKVDGVVHTVVGVMPSGFGFPANTEVWVRIEPRPQGGNPMLRPVLGRLKAGLSREQAESELTQLMAGSEPASERNEWRSRVFPLKDQIVGDIRQTLLIFAGAVGFLLLIACANAGNLFLIRATSRDHEIATRSALGAGVSRILRELVVEGALVGVVAGTAGFALAAAGLRVFVALVPRSQVPRIEEIHVDVRVVAFALIISVAAVLLSSVIPALRVLRRDLRHALNEAPRSVVPGDLRLRKSLVVVELALALVLLTGAALLTNSLLRTRAIDTGFHPRNVLATTVDLPKSVYREAPQMKAYHQRVLDQLAALPGVVSTGAVNWRPLGGFVLLGDFTLRDGRPLPSGFMVVKPLASPGYFRTMGIQLVSGREFTANDTANAPRVVIASQSVAKQLWPNGDALDQQLALDPKPQPDDWARVVGIVADVRQMRLQAQPDMAIYQPFTQARGSDFLAHMTFVVKSVGDIGTTASSFRNVVRTADPEVAVQSIDPMDELVGAWSAPSAFQARVLTTFSVVALLLAAVGVFAVLQYSVTQRTHELGVRKALGAGRGDILTLVLRQALTLIAVGVVLGTVGAYAMSSLISRLLYGVTPTDPATFAAAAVLLIVIGTLAAYAPARRASRIDPATALRRL